MERYIWKWDDGWDVTNTYDMNDNLEEVRRNRAVLNIKIRSVFINELEEEERIWKTSKLAAWGAH